CSRCRRPATGSRTELSDRSHCGECTRGASGHQGRATGPEPKFAVAALRPGRGPEANGSLAIPSSTTAVEGELLTQRESAGLTHPRSGSFEPLREPMVDVVHSSVQLEHEASESEHPVASEDRGAPAGSRRGA